MASMDKSENGIFLHNFAAKNRIPELDKQEKCMSLDGYFFNDEQPKQCISCCGWVNKILADKHTFIIIDRSEEQKWLETYI